MGELACNPSTHARPSLPPGKDCRAGFERVFPGSKGKGVYWPKMPCLRCGCAWWQGEDWDARCLRSVGSKGGRGVQFLRSSVTPVRDLTLSYLFCPADRCPRCGWDCEVGGYDDDSRPLPKFKARFEVRSGSFVILSSSTSSKILKSEISNVIPCRPSPTSSRPGGFLPTRGGSRSKKHRRSCRKENDSCGSAVQVCYKPINEDR